MNNPSPQNAESPKTGKALQLVRVVIAVGLCVGIVVFLVFTVQELEKGQAASKLPSDFGTSDTPPINTAQVQSNDPVADLIAPDPNKFIAILRDNPHPGQFAPFMRADPFGRPPYQQPAAGGEVWEFCAYSLEDASLTDLVAHYDGQAKQVGMKLIKNRPTSEAMPGGIEAAWSDGRRSLRVTAMPLPTQPATPPLKPKTPLQWVVQYSYPAKGQ